MTTPAVTGGMAFGWLPTRWPLWRTPRPLLWYVVMVDVLGLGVLGIGVARFAVSAHVLVTFGLILSCAVISAEVIRRLGEPTGAFKDLSSAWTLPAALLLPPLYVLIIVAMLELHAQLRIRRALLYRRAFSIASIGLCNVGAGLMFRSTSPQATHLSAWLAAVPTAALLALSCAVLATIANTLLVGAAMRLSSPEQSVFGLLADREARLLDTVEITTGIVVTMICVLNPALIPIALPPVLVLQRSLMHGQLNAAARLDTKTGLLNAGTWNRESEREVVIAKRSGAPLALLLIDLDHFKQVNDSYGHLFGDQVLQAVAAALSDQVRSSDLAGRFGGEEFVLLLPGAATSRARAVADRLHGQIGGLAVAPAGIDPIRVTVSIGIALLGQDGTDVTEMLAAADAALYQAKNTGRNRTCLASELG